MKKLLLSLLAIAAVAAANAQLGIEAGVRFANATGKDVEGTKAKTGFQVGVNYAIQVADAFYVEPALNFVQNGYKWSDEGETGKISTNYIQIPATFQYKPEIGSGRLVVGLGPYVGMGIGKIKWSAGGESESYSWKDDGMKKTDVGAKIQAGYQLNNGLYFLLNMDKGLTQLYDDSGKAYHSAFGISVGFRL